MEPKPRDIPEPKTIAGVMQIQEGSGVYIKTREDIASYVEAPLIPACLVLYDKNIRTISTSANGINSDRAGIDIDFDSLSPENQQIAILFGTVIDSREGEKLLILEREIGPETSTDEVEQWALELADKFQRQPMTWAPFYTFEQLVAWGIVSQGESMEEVAAANEYFYDPDNRVFFLSEEHARKFKEDLKVDWESDAS